MKRVLLILTLLIVPQPAVADAARDRQQLGILRDLDGRLAAIGYRLATANLALCAEHQPASGLVVHALDQYDPSLRPAARDTFGFPSNVAIEAVVPGSPAARAGVRSGDGVVAIDGLALPATTPDGPASTAARDGALDRLASRPPDQPLRLSLLGVGGPREAALAPAAACRSAFELIVGPKLVAQSDGRIVQVGAPYFARFGDDQVAVVVAHELAHIILRHRARLEAAGVTWGVLAELGRNGRLFRRTEDEADALGAVLLRNAGYDPRLAVAFWTRDIGGLDGGIFHSRTHGSSQARARNIAAAIAAIPADAPLPWVPPVIATRDQPLR